MWRLIAVGLLVSAVCMGASQTHARPVLHVSTENTAQHFQAQVLEDFVTRANKILAPNTVALELHHSGKLYRGRDVVGALGAGRVAIAAPGLWHLGRLVPDFNAVLLPSFFGREHAFHHSAVAGPLTQHLNEVLQEKADVVVLGTWLDLGYAHVFSTDAGLKTFADLKGVPIRVAGGPANSRRLALMGAEPVVIPFAELPAALENEAVSAVLTTPMTVVSSKLWESGIRHMLITRSYYPFYVPMVSGQIWRRLNEDQRSALRLAWAEAAEDGRKTALAAQEASELVLAQHGISVATPDTAELAETQALLIAQETLIANELGLSEKVQRLVRELIP